MVGAVSAWVNGPTGVNDYGTNGGLVASWIYHDPAGSVGGPVGTEGVGGLQYSEAGSNITLWAKCNPVGLGMLNLDVEKDRKSVV